MLQHIPLPLTLHHAQRCRLACSIGSQQAEGLRRPHHEGEVGDGNLGGRTTILRAVGRKGCTAGSHWSSSMAEISGYNAGNHI